MFTLVGKKQIKYHNILQTHTSNGILGKTLPFISNSCCLFTQTQYIGMNDAVLQFVLDFMLLFFKKQMNLQCRRINNRDKNYRKATYTGMPFIALGEANTTDGNDPLKLCFQYKVSFSGCSLIFKHAKIQFSNLRVNSVFSFYGYLV